MSTDLPPDRREWLERIERDGPQPHENSPYAADVCVKRKWTERIWDGKAYCHHLLPAGRAVLANERERDRLSDAVRRAMSV